jgi:hypothetical protein
MLGNVDGFGWNVKHSSRNARASREWMAFVVAAVVAIALSTPSAARAQLCGTIGYAVPNMVGNSSCCGTVPMCSPSSSDVHVELRGGPCNGTTGVVHGVTGTLGIQCGNCKQGVPCGVPIVSMASGCVECSLNEPEPCSGCQDDNDSGPAPRDNSAPRVPPRPGCTSGNCCENTVGDPVTVATGHHDLDPIVLVDVPGPWAVPLRFSLTFMSGNNWGPRIDENRAGARSIVPDNAFVALGWSNTLQESIAAFFTDLNDAVRLSPNAFAWSGNPCQAGVRREGKKLLYRRDNGARYEFGFSTDASRGGDVCQVSGSNLTLSSSRGVPFRLRVLNFATEASREFEVTDLRTAVVTRFDRHGRILSKRAPTGPSGPFGWQVVYSLPAAPNDSFAQAFPTEIQHDSGHRILLTSVRQFNRQVIRSIDLSFNGVVRNVARLNWDSSTSSFVDSTSHSHRLDSINLPSAGGSWLFSYQTMSYRSTMGPAQPNRLTRVIDPAGVTVFDGRSADMRTGSVGSFAGRMQSFDDRDGGWEFRRRGFSAVQDADPLNNPEGPNNPCAASSSFSVAVIDRRARQLVSGSPKVCTSDGDCAAGFLCTQRNYPPSDPAAPRFCARFSCRTSTGAAAPDEVAQLSEGCGCSNASSLQWTTIAAATPTPLRRIQSRTSAAGLNTTYEHDNQGRVIAKCTGDNNGVVSRADMTSCPASGSWEAWFYEDTGPAPWAVREYQRVSGRCS